MWLAKDMPRSRSLGERHGPLAAGDNQDAGGWSDRPKGITIAGPSNASYARPSGSNRSCSSRMIGARGKSPCRRTCPSTGTTAMSGWPPQPGCPVDDDFVTALGDQRNADQVRAGEFLHLANDDAALIVVVVLQEPAGGLRERRGPPAR